MRVLPRRYGSSEGVSTLAKTAGMLAAQGASKDSDNDDDDDDGAMGFGDEKVLLPWQNSVPLCSTRTCGRANITPSC